MSVADLRQDYTRAALSKADAAPDPLDQFRAWFDVALKSDAVHEANAMTLATATPEGHPSARVVLLKGLDARGLVFYTNYTGRKAQELEANPHAALCFWWDALERQVRVEGRVERVARDEAEAYFHSRPRGSQLGAWASPQSHVIPDRDLLAQRLQDATAQFEGGPVPLPDFWGGYRVVPEAWEFWQGRTSRLHDRLRYTREGGGWRIDRLAP